MEIKLSKRLEKIFKYLSENETICDIGSDHGYLPISYALKYHKKIYATEVAKGPFTKLENNIIKYNCKGLVIPYLSNGLNNLPNDVTTISICGMGGLTILDILNELLNYPNIERIILEPQSHAYEIRNEISKFSYIIINEEYCEEKNHFYNILELKSSYKKVTYSELEKYFGKIPLEKKDPLMLKYAQNLVTILSRINNDKLDEKSKKLLNYAHEILNNFN